MCSQNCHCGTCSHKDAINGQILGCRIINIVSKGGKGGIDGLGESTLWWTPLGCHIVLLSMDVQFKYISFQTFERFS